MYPKFKKWGKKNGRRLRSGGFSGGGFSAARVSGLATSTPPPSSKQPDSHVQLNDTPDQRCLPPAQTNELPVDTNRPRTVRFGMLDSDGDNIWNLSSCDDTVVP